MNDFGFIQVGLPITITLFSGLITISGVFIAAKFASTRFLKTHNDNEKRLFEDFKLQISTQLISIEKSKIGWAELDVHRLENKNSIDRVHERVDNLVEDIDKKVLDIKESVYQIAQSVGNISGAFNEHTRK